MPKPVIGSGEWASRGQEVRDSKTRSTVGLGKGGEESVRAGRAAKAERAEARFNERRERVDAMVAERAGSLPPEMAKSPIVLDSIRNLSRVQIILDGILDEIDRDVNNDKTESLIKSVGDIYSKVKSGHDDLLAKWPRQEDTRPVQRIPASVAEWIIAESAKPVEVVGG